MIYIRNGHSNDALAIAELHERENKRPAKHSYIQTCLNEYPSIIAMKEEKLIGFILCHRFAPDILELSNMLLASEWRSKGVGSRMLEQLEHAIQNDWASLILVNSTLYGNPERRTPLEFYLKHKFKIIHSTANTNIFAKEI